MSLFTISESNIENLRSAIGSAAYFIITGKPTPQSPEGPKTLRFCRAKSDNGIIDPAWLLAAFVLEMNQRPSDVYIVPGYSLSSGWETAFAGITHLGQEQKVTLHLESKSAAVPSGKFVQVIEVALAPSRENAVITNSPNQVIDNLFVPGSASSGKIGSHGTHTIPRLYMMAAIVMEKQFGASVLALITNRNGGIVTFASKGSQEGGCAHAEVKALLDLKGQLPDGGAFFSTLKPCTMCAGLLSALDPKGTLRKYWVRDDPSFGANWYKGMGLVGLPNALPLDKDCGNAKYLKLPGGESFLETFTTVRSKNEPTDAEKQQWFSLWLTSLKLPDNLYFVANGELLRGVSPQAKTAIRDAKKDITTLNQLYTKLGRYSQSPKEMGGRKYLGLRNEDREPIKKSHDTYIDTQTQKIYPARIIDFIPGNPASAGLRDAARLALMAKLKKYGKLPVGEADKPSSRAPNPNVEKVLVYLLPFLKEAGVNL